MGIIDTIRERCSVRSYQQHRITREQIAHLLEAARWAPSPHNRQPWRFVVLLRNSEQCSPTATPPRATIVADAMAARWREHLARDGQDEALINQRLERSRQRIADAPALILACLYLEDLERYPDEERQANETIMAIQSLGCAIQNMLLAAHSLGLDTGWMCAPLFCQDVVQAALQLDETIIPHALITVGYRAGEPVQRERLPLEQLVIWRDT